METHSLNIYSEEKARMEEYRAFDKEFGAKVKSNMSRKEFCSMIIDRFIYADHVVWLDINDIYTTFRGAPVIDGCCVKFPADNGCNAVAAMMDDITARHPSYRISRMLVQVEANPTDAPTTKQISDLITAITDKGESYGLDIELIWCYANTPSLTPGEMQVIVGCAFCEIIDNPDARIRMSRRLSHLLRHTDRIDSQGFIDIISVIWKLGITREELDYIVQNDTKNRYEIVGTKIRCRNGHSGKEKIDAGFTIVEPPAVLYHCTTDAALASVMRDGLLPMSRQYVQCSTDPDTCIEAAKRHKGTKPVLLKIDALGCHLDGHRFCLTSNGVWQVETIPPRFLQIVDLQ